MKSKSLPRFGYSACGAKSKNLFGAKICGGGIIKTVKKLTNYRLQVKDKWYNC